MSRGRRARGRAADAPPEVALEAPAAVATEDEEQPDPGDEHRLSDEQRARDALGRPVLVVPEWLIELEVNAPEAS